MISRFLLASCACLLAWPAAALLIRADRDDAEYLELASRYTSSVRLHAPAGEGVLIAPRWILTTAKLAEGLRGSKPVASVHAHPEAGVALVLLREPVRDAEPTPVYRGRDEAGKAVVIAGHGGDGRKRAGINTVDGLDARTLELRIKQGDDASDLQGRLTAAELGAAAYLQVDGELFIAGIATAVTGERETYARVSSLADWIDETMFRAAADEARGLETPPRKRR